METQDFANIVTNRRKELGLSRAEASRVWNVPYRTLQDWEARKRTPRGFARQAIIDKINEPPPAIRTRTRGN